MDLRHGTRRHLARRFPYAVVFAERPDRLLIIAVAHCKRHPDYWRERLPDFRSPLHSDPLAGRSLPREQQFGPAT